MESKKRQMKIKKIYNKGHEAHHIYNPEGIAPTVREMHGKVTKVMIGNVLPTTTTTNTQSKPTTKTSAQVMSQQTSRQSILTKSQTTTSLLPDFLAKLLALLESGKDLTTQEAHSFLRLHGLQGIKDLNICSLKTLRGSSITIKEKPSQQSWKRFQNWGIAASGKCLTARISGSRRTGNACSLSDILEDSVDDKYFLSEKAVRRITQNAAHTKDQETIREYKDYSPTIRTPSGGGSLPLVKGLNSKGLHRLDDVKLIAKKRTHDTPKEINTYLKKYKDRTITEIAKELNLPKTQVEHYFRDDKSRAIPSPEIWLQLKDLLRFDDTYDKQVTEIYEKEYEFESAKRVYDSSGIAQTINTGKTGLYEIGDYRSDEGYRKRKDGNSPTLTAGNRANSKGSAPVPLVNKIRRLTPIECERLQGFPDNWTAGVSDTQRYKQLGNAVTTNVVEAIITQMQERLNGV